jgi:hypothetical protein
MVEDSNKAERPRVEPEIIPPARSHGGSDWRAHAAYPYEPAWSATHRIYVGRFGPIAIVLMLLIAGFIAAAILSMLIGAVLLWIPLVAFLVVAGAIVRLLRGR